MTRAAQLSLFGLLVALVLLSNIPLKVPGRDSGVFLYVGEQILDGKIPYRDVWDHKGPLLYYINALGLWLGQGAIGGVWVLEYVSLGTAVFLSFHLLNKAFGLVPAIISTIIWLGNASLLQVGGNLTEEYTLPLQFAALYLFWRSLTSKNDSLHFFTIGLLAGAAFLLRPNNIGTPAAIMAYVVGSSLAARAWSILWRKVGAFLAGAGALVGGTAVYFAAHQALFPLIDQLFVYNFQYAATSFENRIVASLAGLFAAMPFASVVIVLTAWVLGWVQAARQKTDRPAWRPLILVASVGLPIEAFLAGYAGGFFAHYFMALLPMFALLIGYFMAGLWPHLSRLPQASAYGILFIIISLTGYQPVRVMAYNLAQKPWPPGHSQILAEIEQAAQPHEYLLMWGAEASFNFLLAKESPSRFVYQYPLYTAVYATPEMAANFLDGVARKRPLIIDTSPSNTNVPPLAPVDRVAWLQTEDARRLAHIGSETAYLDDIFEFIETNYVLTGVTEENKWRIYKYSGSQ